MEVNHRLLVYTQDPGGVKFLLPLLMSLEKHSQSHIHYINHEQSIDLIPENIRNKNIYLADQYPLSVQHWKRILDEHKIDAVLCTLSSTRLDLSNADLVKAARLRQIPTLGFLDHWKGLDRFFNQDGEPEYAPDWLGVIDDVCVQNVRQCKVPVKNIAVVGHPWLEHIAVESKKHISVDMDKIRVLLVSQPDSTSSSFESIFCKKTHGQNLIGRIVSELTDYFPTCSVSLRPHPKEKPQCDVPDEVSVDTGKSENLLAKYDIFIGFDSMLLFEAHLAGRPCVVLRLPEFDRLSDRQTPYQYAPVVKDINKLGRQINNTLLKGQITPAFEPLGSLAKCEALLDDFLKTIKVRYA